MADWVRYLVLYLVLFLAVTLTVTAVFAIFPIVWSTITTYPGIIAVAALVAFIAVLAEVLDDIRSAKRGP